ncbi:MAG: hypothetical protein ACRD22_08335 [Terriglobia bacterium]
METSDDTQKSQLLNAYSNLIMTATEIAHLAPLEYHDSTYREILHHMLENERFAHAVAMQQQKQPARCLVMPH